MTDPVLLAEFDGLTWAPGAVEAWLGDTPPAGLPVSSVCLLVTSPGRLLLVDVRRRGWDLPGGHLDDGEDPADAILRELGEEAGVEAGQITEPVVLGWFRLPDALMLVFTAHFTQDAETLTLQTRVPDEIASAELFPLTYLPAGSADRIWFPFVEKLDDTAR